jgi:hypothetical protein
LIALIIARQVSQFYTGNEIESIYSNISSGESLYNNYQKHFEENEVGELTLYKIPYILGIVFLKVLSLWGLAKVIINQNTKFYLIYVIPFLLFSIARGTSFEIFELGTFTIFCILVAKRFNLKAFFTLVTLFLIAVLIYNFNLTMRYSGAYTLNQCAGSACIDNNSIFLSFGIFHDIAWLLFGYFGFGLWYLIEFLNYMAENFDLKILFPIYNLVENYSNIGLCEIQLYCGAMWRPSLEMYLTNFGLFTLIVIILHGMIFKLMLNSYYYSKNVVPLLGAYMIFLSMVALPIGGFVTSSSANKIIIILSALYLIDFRKVGIFCSKSR